MWALDVCYHGQSPAVPPKGRFVLLASWRGRGVQCLAGQAGPEATQHHLQEADVADVPRGQLGIFEVCPPMLLILSMKVETLKIISTLPRGLPSGLYGRLKDPGR